MTGNPKSWFLLALLTSAPAHAAGLSIANIGNNSAAAGANTLAIMTTAACPAGNAVVMADAVNANVPLHTPTDRPGDKRAAPRTNNTLPGHVGRMEIHWV